MAEHGGLPWYQIWTDFSGHPKTLDLCARLKERNAGMYVIRLFEHCAEHALDGHIPAALIEEAAGWRGRPGVLLAALDASAWLEAAGEGRVVHGWEERNGSRIRKALRDAKKPRGNKPASSEGPASVPRGTDEGSAGVDVDGDVENTEKPAAAATRARRGGKRRKLDPEAQQGDPPADAGGDRPRAETSGPTPTAETVATTPPVPRPGREAPLPVSVATPPAAGPSQASTPPTPPPEAGKTNSARAAANRGPIEDEIPHRPLALVDLADGGLGPLGAEFKRRAEEGFKHGPLLWAAADKRAAVATELEGLIGDEQRLEQLVAIWIQDALAREVGGGPPTASMTGVLLDLRRLAPLLAADPFADLRKACAPWVRCLEAIQALPPETSPLPPGAFQSLLLTLSPHLDSNALTLTAQSDWHREAVWGEPEFQALIREAVGKFIGRKVTVNLVAKEAQAEVVG